MDNPIIVFLYCYKLKICITDSLSFDYADFPCRQITFSYQSHGHSADTFSNTLKSPQKFIPTSFLLKNQYFILNYAEWHLVCFFEKSFRVPKNRLRLIVEPIGRDKTIMPKVYLLTTIPNPLHCMSFHRGG